MYEIVTLRDRIRVDPKNAGGDYGSAVENIIRKDYIGKIVEDRSLLVGLVDVESVGEGMIIPGDASIYYDTVFKMLAFMPTLHETIKGTISAISEVGAAVNIGPIDGLVHISQTMNDFVDFSKNALVGRKTRASVKPGESVLASVIALSTKGIMKVGLTMRSPGLGSLSAKKKEPRRATRERKHGA
jgi:DNA-directed RNA polymerase subunit E'